MVFILVGDAVEYHMAGVSRVKRFTEIGGLPLRSEIPLALHQGEFVVNLLNAPFGSTITIPYSPLAM